LKRCQWLIPVILASYEAEIGRITVEADRANSLQAPIYKITREKWTGGVTQAMKCLVRKCEALSSKHSLPKKKKKKK
jgi:hypothetical protein